MADGKITLIGFLAILLIILSAGLGVYYEKSSDLGKQVISLNSQVNSILADPSTVTSYFTITSTSVSLSPVELVVTNTQIVTYSTTSTSISTSDVFPFPDNVTVDFTQVSGNYNYAITAGSINYSGGSDQDLSFPVTPVFQGESISISASIESGIGGCIGTQQVSVMLYVNGSLVSQSSQVCGTGGASISYIL